MPKGPTESRQPAVVAGLALTIAADLNASSRVISQRLLASGEDLSNAIR